MFFRNDGRTASRVVGVLGATCVVAAGLFFARNAAAEPLVAGVALQASNGKYVGFSSIPFVGVVGSEDSPNLLTMVDWNGELLRHGDTVSFAKDTSHDPDYLYASGDDHGKIKSREYADGPASNFVIEKIAKGDAAQPNDHIIRHGDHVALKSHTSCSFVSQSTSWPHHLHADGCTPNKVHTFRIWWKFQTGTLSGPRIGSIESCFGGEGPGCAGVLFSATWIGSEIELPVSVGSIAHDNCCERSPLGKACGGVFDGKHANHDGHRPKRGAMAAFGIDQLDFLGLGPLHDGSCWGEWQKAWDSSHITSSKTWKKRFGHYRNPTPHVTCPSCATSGKDGWGLVGDVMETLMTTRKTILPGVPASHSHWPAYPGDPYRVLGNEIKEYRLTPAQNLLFAPVGQSLDSSDSDFCITGRLSWKKNLVGIWHSFCAAHEAPHEVHDSLELGGLNLRSACVDQHGPGYALVLHGPRQGPRAAYNWKCRHKLTHRAELGIDENRACEKRYGAPALAATIDPNDAASWYCHRPVGVALNLHPAAHPLLRGTELGALDLARACVAEHGAGFAPKFDATKPAVHAVLCAKGATDEALDFRDACVKRYGAPAEAALRDRHDPNSWHCRRPPASTRIEHTSLGGIDVNQACVDQFGQYGSVTAVAAAPGPRAAFNWTCRRALPLAEAKPDFEKACQKKYGADTTAALKNPAEVNSWYCYR